MESNLLLRRLRYALSLRNRDVQDIFARGKCKVSDEHVRALLHKEGDEEFVAATVEELSAFLDGLIVHRRGTRKLAPGQSAPSPILAATNNTVLRKLRIAFDLKERDMLDLLELGGFRLSKSELGALFRKEGHKHYRACGDQVLRYFVGGLTKKLRPGEPDEEGDGHPASVSGACALEGGPCEGEETSATPSNVTSDSTTSTTTSNTGSCK